MNSVSYLIAAAALGAATPAFATGTIACRSTINPTDGPALWLTVGSGPGSGVIQVRLEEGNRSFTTGQGADGPSSASPGSSARRSGG